MEKTEQHAGLYRRRDRNQHQQRLLATDRLLSDMRAGQAPSEKPYFIASFRRSRLVIGHSSATYSYGEDLMISALRILVTLRLGANPAGTRPIPRQGAKPQRPPKNSLF